jgi:hypothetical protein
MRWDELVISLPRIDECGRMLNDRNEIATKWNGFCINEMTIQQMMLRVSVCCVMFLLLFFLVGFYQIYARASVNRGFCRQTIR